jgi:secondary thiamine-phosphate synthase enzyme
MDAFDVRIRTREEVIDVTAEIQKITADSGVREGVCVVFVPHTTAGVTINENADPDVKADILMALGKAVPDSLPYRHAEGNSPAHVKASLVGSSVMVVISDGRLRLGTWQGICLCEFDGPRTRKVWVKIIGK